jgi:hypothetical protein
MRARELKYVTFRARLALIQRYVSSGCLLDVGCACGYLIRCCRLAMMRMGLSSLPPRSTRLLPKRGSAFSREIVTR